MSDGRRRDRSKQLTWGRVQGSGSNAEGLYTNMKPGTEREGSNRKVIDGYQ
jgi:hypothetical protein